MNPITFDQPQEPTLEVTTRPAYTPAIITADSVVIQFEKACAGYYEVVKFGVMMLAIEASLTRETGSFGQPAAGSGLKGWLVKNCPEINYKTACRYKSDAAKACGLQGVELEEAAGWIETEEARQALVNVSGRSLRRGGKREGAGRKLKDIAAAIDADGELAAQMVNEAIEKVVALVVVENRCEGVATQRIRAARMLLSDAIAHLDAILESRGD